MTAPAADRRWPRRRPTTAVALAVGVLVSSVVVVAALRHGALPIAAPTPTTPTLPTPGCVATSATGRLRLSVEQAENATTIAAVAERDGLGDRAVTVALAAALQESKLRNVAYGDQDSLGVFQQRPSQGWGTPAQLLVPSYAARAFFAALVKVTGWEAMPVADAAQAVQRSAAGDAYGPWEHQASILAEALTGQTPAAFACRFASTPPAADPDALPAAVTAELGPAVLGSSVSEARGWTVASWLVAHGAAYAVSSVSFMGQVWTSSSGEWLPSAPARPYVEVGRT